MQKCLINFLSEIYTLDVEEDKKMHNVSLFSNGQLFPINDCGVIKNIANEEKNIIK